MPLFCWRGPLDKNYRLLGKLFGLHKRVSYRMKNNLTRKFGCGEKRGPKMKIFSTQRIQQKISPTPGITSGLRKLLFQNAISQAANPKHWNCQIRNFRPGWGVNYGQGFNLGEKEGGSSKLFINPLLKAHNT